jgi:CheY-like chemotaxis protein
MHLYDDRRKVLLVDENSRTQKLRATMLRGREIEVHTAENIAHAESLWRTRSYDLVLLAAENSAQSYLVSAQIRQAKPQQRIALLVGPPTYVREVARAAKKAPKPGHAETAVSSAQPSSHDPEASPQWQQIVQKVVADWYSAKMLTW